MTNAAKCKVCGVAHFGAAHVWNNLAAPKLSEPAAKIILEPKGKPDPAKGATLAQYLSDLRAAKAAYMRDYRARKRTDAS